MRWQQGKWYRKILIFFSFLFIFLIILSIGVTLYLNKVLTHEKLVQLVASYSKSYLNREISFKDYKIDLLKGIVLYDVLIKTNPDLEYSTEFSIKEIQLKYDFNKLIKLKLFINKIVADKLILQIDKNTLYNEIAYYRDRFSSAPKTNVKVKKSTKKSFNVKIIRLQNSSVTYKQSGRKVNCEIDSIEFLNEKVRKVRNDIIINYKNKKYHIAGDVLFADKITFNWNIKQGKNFSLYCKVNTPDFKKFELHTIIKYKVNKIDLSASVIRKHNVLFITSALAKDDINTYNIKKGFVNLINFYCEFSLSAKLKDFNNEYLGSYKTFNIIQYNLNMDIDLLIGIKLNRLSDYVLNGTVYLNNSDIKKNQHLFYIKKSKIIFKNNAINIKKGLMQYKNYDFTFNINNKNFKMKNSIYLCQVFSKKLNVNNFVTKRQVIFDKKVENLQINSIIDPKKRIINLKNISFNYVGAKVLMQGNIDYKDKNHLLFEFDQQIKNLDAEEFLEIYKVKDISGKINAETKFKMMSISNRSLTWHYLKGKSISHIDHKKIKNMKLTLLYKLRKNKNRIYFYESYLEFDYNRFNFWGFYDLSHKLFKLNAPDNRIFLSSLRFLENKVSGDIAYDFFLEKKDKQKQDSKLSIKSGKIDFLNLKFNNITGEIAVQSNFYKGQVKINQFYKGTIISDFSGDFNQNISLKSKGDRIKVSPLCMDLLNENITGKLKFKFNLEKTPNSKIGTLSVNAQKGEISDTIYQKNIGGLTGLFEELQVIFYKDITLNADIENNRLKFNQFNIICSDQQHDINGSYDFLNKNIDIKITSKFTEVFLRNMLKEMQLAGTIDKEQNDWYYLKPIIWKGQIGVDKPRFE